ncbi:Protein of unknown function [Raineyella antarctica]|uniref:DUF3073 domain-containing protein n=1 Tax=Raineyella antarctica TaxID=1577474 RepID=A0A1G6GCX4_9ACTN|nr:DUF3073 domain-containing protein [Raineyella antarctica]SDB79841.1 Protein of unknown function [Raineyella antarctica]
MGRGRAKAKQTKVARELKYRPIDTDFSSLERELRGGDSYRNDFRSDSHDEEDVPDAYADLAARYNADDDDGYGGMRASG